MLTLAASTPDSLQREVYAGEALTDAELSRDRRLMAESYLRNGDRYLNNQGLVVNQNKAQQQFEEAEKLARKKSSDAADPELLPAFEGVAGQGGK